VVKAAADSDDFVFLLRLYLFQYHSVPLTDGERLLSFRGLLKRQLTKLVHRNTLRFKIQPQPSNSAPLLPVLKPAITHTAQIAPHCSEMNDALGRQLNFAALP
jgi:hypothetical protein